MKTTTLPLKHSINCAPFRLALLLIPLALACFALSPQARAACEDGCNNGSSTRGKVMMLSLATPAALEIQRLVGVRSLAIPTEALIPQ
jgi:hypothetical protein